MLKRFLQVCITFAILILLFPGKPSQSATPYAAMPYQMLLPLVANNPLPLAAPEWIGPGGGAITDLTFDPSNSNVAFAATYGRGVFKSTDRGQTWQNVSLGFENLDITAIEISPKNSLILFAGTYRGGVYKSANGGESWYRSDAGIQDEAITYAIEIDPIHTQKIYVATRGLSNNGGPPWNGVVYRSEDGGQTWLSVLSNVGGSGQEDWAYDLSIYPRSTNLVYAATHEHGAYRSTNYGQSWQAINNGVSDHTSRAIEPDPRPNSGVVYLGVFRPTGIFKSQNSGDSWSLKTNNISDVHTYRIQINPNEKNTLYLATFGQGIMKSADNGENWAYAGLRDETILDIDIRPGSYNTLLSATLDNGLFITKNNGASWAHSQNGLDASAVTSVVVPPGASQTLYASLFPGWVARSTDGGATWTDYHDNLTDKNIHTLESHPTNPNLLYALTDSSGLYRRDTQSGTGWQAIGSNLPATNLQSTSPLEHPFHQNQVFESLFPGESRSTLSNLPNNTNTPLLSLAFAATNPTIGYLGTSGSGVYRSIDDGISWAAVGLNGTSVYSLVVAPNEPNRVYAATNAAGSVQMSLDGGANWTDTNLSGLTAYSLAIPPGQPDILYAGTSNGVFAFISGNWTAMGISGSTVTSIAAHPTVSSRLYAGTTNGVFISHDGGLNWVAGPDELNGIQIQNISFDPHNAHIVYYATQLHGILKAYQ